MNYEIVGAKTCPYVQRVKILLEEKGIEYRHTNIDLKNKPEWLAALSPFGKVPLLKLLNGQVLFESQVINEYLEEVDGSNMHPENAIDRAKNRAWVELISTITMRFGGYYYARDKQTMDNRLDEVSTLLSTLDDAFVNGPFFNGEKFSLLDVAAAPLFSRIALLNEYHKLNLLVPYPKLMNWSEALLNRPSVQATVTSVFQHDVLVALRQKEFYIAQFLAA